MLFFDLLAASSARNVDRWPELMPDLWIAACLGAACGTALALRDSGKGLLPFTVVGVAIADFTWLMLPQSR